MISWNYPASVELGYILSWIIKNEINFIRFHRKWEKSYLISQNWDKLYPISQNWDKLYPDYIPKKNSKLQKKIGKKMKRMKNVIKIVNKD